MKSNDRGKAPSETPAPLQFSLPELDYLSDLLVEAFESAESQHPSTISNLDTDLALYEKKCVEHISRRRSPGEPRVDVEDPIAFWFIQVFMQKYFCLTTFISLSNTDIDIIGIHRMFHAVIL